MPLDHAIKQTSYCLHFNCSAVTNMTRLLFRITTIFINDIRGRNGFFVAMCLVIYDMRERQRDSVEHIIA